MLSGDICTENLPFKRILALILIFQISAFEKVHTITSDEKTWYGLLACFSRLKELSVSSFSKDNSQDCHGFDHQCSFLCPLFTLAINITVLPIFNSPIVHVLPPVCVRGHQLWYICCPGQLHTTGLRVWFSPPHAGEEGRTLSCFTALCVVLPLLYLVQVEGEMNDSVTECSYFVKGHWNVEFVLCLSKWQQLLNVTKGTESSISKGEGWYDNKSNGIMGFVWGKCLIPFIINRFMNDRCG